MPVHRFLGIGLFIICVCVLPLPSLVGQESESESGAVERGLYVLRAAGGCTCHMDPDSEEFSLAGGRPIETPFGTIYGTNITPDEETGIGSFSDEDFDRAMREGVGPDGTVYYPVFPYTSFTKMTDQDVRDLKAYLFSLPAVRKEDRPPEFRFPYSNRTSVSVWRGLHFDPERFQPTEGESDEWNRGAYLAEALAHCGECHTPRTFMGATDVDLYFAGSVEGPEGQLAPNITPHEATGIGSWSERDISWYLQTGFEPDGHDAQGLMGEVVQYGYSYLEPADLDALAVYLKSIEPIENEVKPE
jgi:mono/diheme cytochrome c family protein